MSNHLRLHFHLGPDKEKIARNIKTQQLNQRQTSKKYQNSTNTLPIISTKEKHVSNIKTEQQSCHLGENLAVVHPNDVANHLRKDDHVPQVRLHHVRLLVGLGRHSQIQKFILIFGEEHQDRTSSCVSLTLVNPLDVSTIYYNT